MEKQLPNWQHTFETRLFRNVAFEPHHHHGIVRDFRWLLPEAKKREDQQKEGDNNDYDPGRQAQQELEHN